MGLNSLRYSIIKTEKESEGYDTQWQVPDNGLWVKETPFTCKVICDGAGGPLCSPMLSPLRWAPVPLFITAQGANMMDIELGSASA